MEHKFKLGSFQFTWCLHPQGWDRNLHIGRPLLSGRPITPKQQDTSPSVRRPNILDVVRAVTAVAPDYPEVTVWWYAPEPELTPGSNHSGRGALEVVVETASLRSPDLDGLATHLSQRLGWQDVAVRAHRGPDEKRLFRMLTNR